MSVTCYFIGPLDDRDCDWCADAVNGNPYTLDDCPVPGDGDCMSNCRHLQQIDGDAPADIPTYTWTGEMGFAETVPEEAAPAQAAIGDTLASAIGDDGYIDMSPDEIAATLNDQGITLADVEPYIDPDSVAAVQDILQEQAAAAPVESQITDHLLTDDLQALRTLIDTNPDAADHARQLAAQGFEDANAAQAYTLADALGGKVVLRDGKWYVDTALRESMREGGAGSGDRGHAGRPGSVGGSSNDDRSIAHYHTARFWNLRALSISGVHGTGPSPELDAADKKMQQHFVWSNYYKHLSAGEDAARPKGREPKLLYDHKHNWIGGTV